MNKEHELFQRIYESAKVKELLREATYKWEIDPIDRSWFVTTKGELLADVSHRIIMKHKFSDEWDALKSRGMEDAEIDSILEERLIKVGYVKIGELDEFYVSVNQLDHRVKDALFGFANSILKVRNVSNSIVSIQLSRSKKELRYTMGNIANDALFKLEEQTNVKFLENRG